MSKLRVGIIGCGGISGMHMMGYNALPDEVEVVACCDINEERLKRYAKDHNIPNTFTDFNEMVKMKDLDAVSVTTWNNVHCPATVAALKAGKHVLCEKPMALSADEARQMEAAAKESGKLLQIGFVRRFEQNTRIIKDYIKNGKIGDVYHVRAECTRRAGNPMGWFADKKRSGGGPLIDLGVHVIDLARFLMGRPKAVSAYGATFNHIGTRMNLKDYTRYTASDYDGDKSDVEDVCIAMIRFDNGGVVTLEVSFSENIKNDNFSVQIHGTKGGASFDPIEIFTEEDDYLENITPIYSKAPDAFNQFFTDEIHHFVDCASGKIDPKDCIAPAEDGVELMKILDAVYESARTGHEVIIND
jgi:predicted dehydrogenase